MDFPVQLTPPAMARIQKLLEKNGEPSAFLRIGVKGGGCSGFEYVMKLDSSPRESDLVLPLDHGEVRCDPKSAKILEGATLHYTGNLIGGGFEFDNPNAEKSCGCGSSFSLKSAAQASQK